MRQDPSRMIISLFRVMAGALLWLAVLLPLDVAAANPPLQSITGHFVYVRGQLPVVAYGIAGVVVLGIGAAAMMGRFQWGWFFGVIGALALVAGQALQPTAAPTERGRAVDYVISNGADNTIINQSNALLVATADRSQHIGYALGGLGAMGLAALAIFGRFRWGWLFGLCGGLMLLAGYITASTYITTAAPFQTALAPDPAVMNLDQGNDAALFNDSKSLAYNTANRTRNIAFALAGLGVIGLGALAMLGRFQWRWFFAIIGGIVIIAGLNEGLQYLTG